MLQGHGLEFWFDIVFIVVIIIIIVVVGFFIGCLILQHWIHLSADRIFSTYFESFGQIG